MTRAFALVVMVVGCGSEPGRGVPLAGAVFEPNTNRAWLSLLGPEGSVELVVLEEATLRERQRKSIAMQTEIPTTVLLDGLQANTSYRVFRAHGDGLDEPGWAFHTRPQTEDDVDFSFVVGADVDLEFSSPVFDAMSATSAQFTLLLGDAPYTDNAPFASTLEEYRRAHRNLRESAAMQTLLGPRGTFAIYDDHEVANNWDKGFNAERVAAGLQAWDEYHPLAGEERYRSVRWGALAEIFILDTRAFRSRNDEPDTSSKTMLGAEQLSWLKNGLVNSTAPFKLIATTVPLDFLWRRLLGGICHGTRRPCELHHRRAG